MSAEEGGFLAAVIVGQQGPGGASVGETTSVAAGPSSEAGANHVQAVSMPRTPNEGPCHGVCKVNMPAHSCPWARGTRASG